MNGEQSTSMTVDALRRAFDRSFAEAPVARVPEASLLAIRLGTSPYALRVAEIAAVLSNRTVTWVPSPVRELLGVVSFRGTVVPVYDLRSLVGYASGPVPRWLVIASAAPVGLAFDQLEAHVHLSHDAIVPMAPRGVSDHHARHVVHAPDGTRPLVDIASVLGVIHTLARQATPRKER